MGNWIRTARAGTGRQAGSSHVEMEGASEPGDERERERERERASCPIGYRLGMPIASSIRGRVNLVFSARNNGWMEVKKD
jgi:hypothetical protein